ncbi:conserved hypothetical protein [Neospora caninum Liverpool]|uniref:Uncharacterized protein n=1 Tax=Neospora caninum (strain Liverpool) TaxID=572307 RepID=F0VKQ4_NEOCL|nr:conserved hypothetical protein [Neospora caninum Liverpool]CBZ54655.1 conserved hypothetical protein [Neospora caninum Liverpool]|eukprot:XP_003884685.1 conserved hypothetical protein [Neospora caninum Liverpool]
MEDPRVSCAAKTGHAASQPRTYGAVRERDRDGRMQVPEGEENGEAPKRSHSQYAVAARLVASCAVDLQTFPLASPTAFAVPRPSCAPVEGSLFSRLPLIGRFLVLTQGTEAGSPGETAGRLDAGSASLSASSLCCPELSSLLPNSHVCRWRNQVYVTAWRGSTVYCYVLAVPSSCFLEDEEKPGQSPTAAATYYTHNQPVGIARLIPEHGLLLVAGILDENDLDPDSGDVFLLQYDNVDLDSSSQSSSSNRFENALVSFSPSVPSPFQDFKVFFPPSETDCGSTSEPVPLRIKRGFRLAAPIHGLSLAVSCQAGLLLFSADARKKKASVIFLSDDALEDLKTDADATGSAPETAPRHAAARLAASEAPPVAECEDRGETAGAAGDEPPRPSFPTENVPFSLCTSEHLPTLPSKPTAYALDRRAQRFFVGGFDAEDGRVWLAVTNFGHLRPELDEEDYQDPGKLRLQRAFLEEQARRLAEDDETASTAELDRPVVLLFPLLSCLRYAAKVAASLKRKAAQNLAEKASPERSMEPKPGEASWGQRLAGAPPPGAADERDYQVSSVLGEPWGAQFYRPVAVAELRSLLNLDVEETFSSGREGLPSGRPTVDDEAATLLLSHDLASARGYSCSGHSPSRSLSRAGGASHALPRNASPDGRLKPSPQLEQDEAVEIAHIAVSRSGRRIAVTLSTCEVLILVKNDGVSPVVARAGDASPGRAENPTAFPRQKSPHMHQAPPLGAAKDKAATAPPCLSAAGQETYLATVPDAASDPSSAPFLPWLYLPAPFVTSLRISASLGRREVRPAPELLASALPRSVAAPPAKSGVENAFSLASSLQRFPDYEGLSGLLGCAFSSAPGAGRSEKDEQGSSPEEDAEEVLLLVLGVRASRERLRGLAGFEREVDVPLPEAVSTSPPSCSPSGPGEPASRAETVPAAREAKTASSLDGGQGEDAGSGSLPASRGENGSGAGSAGLAVSHPHKLQGRDRAGLLCDELSPTPSMAVDVCALSLKAVKACLDRGEGAVAWKKPVLAVLPNAAPHVTGNAQRWLCPCSAAAAALGVGLLPPSWGEEGCERAGDTPMEPRRRAVTGSWGRGAEETGGTADREGVPNALTLVLTLESSRGREETERENLAARDARARRGTSTFRIWAVEAQSVEHLTAELRRRSRFPEAERVCANALENLREQDVFFEPEEGEAETASETTREERDRRQRAANVQWYRDLLEDIREARWAQRGSHPDAAEEDFKVFFSLRPKDPSWLVSQALAYDPFQLVSPSSFSVSCVRRSARRPAIRCGKARLTERRALPGGGEEERGESETARLWRREEERGCEIVRRWAQGLERLDRMLVYLLEDSVLETITAASGQALASRSALRREQRGDGGHRETAGARAPERLERDRDQLRERLRRCRLLALFCNSPASSSLPACFSGATGSRPGVQETSPPLVLSTPLQPFGWGAPDPSLPLSGEAKNVLDGPSLPSSEVPSHAFSSSRCFDAVGGASFSSLSCLSLSLSSLLLSPTSSFSAETSSAFLRSLCCVWSATCRLDCIVAVLQGRACSETAASAVADSAHWPRILSSLPEALHPVHYAHLLPLLSPAPLSSPLPAPLASSAGRLPLSPCLSPSGLAASASPAPSLAAENGGPSFLVVESDPRRFLSWTLRRLFVILKRTELIRSVALPLLQALLSLAVKQRLPQSLRKANRRSRKRALERATALHALAAVSEACAKEEPQDAGGSREQDNGTPENPAEETRGTADAQDQKRERAEKKESDRAREDARVSALAAAVLAVGVSSKTTPPSESSSSRRQPPRATEAEPVSPRRVASGSSDAHARGAAGDQLEASLAQRRVETAKEEDRSRAGNRDESVLGPRSSGVSTALSESLGSERKAKNCENMDRASPWALFGSRPDGYASNWQALFKPPGPPSPLLLSVAGDLLRALYALHVALTQFLLYEEEQKRRRAMRRARQTEDGDEASSQHENLPRLTADERLIFPPANWEGRAPRGAPARRPVSPAQEDLDFFTFLRLPLHSRLALLTGVAHWRGDRPPSCGEQEREEAVRVVEKLRRGVVQPQVLFDEIFWKPREKDKAGEEESEGEATGAAFDSQLRLSCAFGGGRGRLVQRSEFAESLARLPAAPTSLSTVSSLADFCACLNAFCASPISQQLADFCLEVLPWSSPSLVRSLPATAPRLSADKVDALHLGRRSLAVVAEVVQASSPLVAPSLRLLRRRSDVGEVALCAVYHRSSLLSASSLLSIVDRLYNALPQSFEEELGEQPAGQEELGEMYGGRSEGTETERRQAERTWFLERRKRLRVLAGGADMLEQHLDVVEFLNRHLTPAPPSVTFQQLKTACLSPSSARMLCASLLRALCRAPRVADAGEGTETAGSDAGLSRLPDRRDGPSASGEETAAVGAAEPITCAQLLDRAVYVHRRACAALAPEDLYEILLTTCATEVSFSSLPRSPSAAGGFASVFQHLRPLARASSAALGRERSTGSAFSPKRALLEKLLERWRDVALLGGDAQLAAFFPRAAASLLACARDLVNAAPSIGDPSLAAAQELLRICLVLDSDRRRVRLQRKAERNAGRNALDEPALGSGFPQEKKPGETARVQRAANPATRPVSPGQQREDSTLGFERQSEVLARQVRSELRFLAFLEALNALVTSPALVSAGAATVHGTRPSLAGPAVAVEGKKVFGVEFEALASVAGSSAKAARAAMVGAARGGGALARGAVEVSGSAASSTMRLLRSYGSSASVENRLVHGEATHRADGAAESSRGFTADAANCVAQETAPRSRSAGPVSSAVWCGSPTSGLLALAWPSTPLQVRVAATVPGGLARLVQAILRACPEAADENRLLEKLASLLDDGEREGTWRGRWRLHESRAWAYWVRGRVDEALRVLATLLVWQQQPFGGGTETKRRETARRTSEERQRGGGGADEADSGEEARRERPPREGRTAVDGAQVLALTGDVRVDLRPLEQTVERTVGKREGRGRRNSNCLRRILAEADPSLSVLTLQFSNRRPLPFLSRPTLDRRSSSSSLSFETASRARSVCLSPNLRGALLALAVRRCDALRLPLLLGAFAAVQHEHFMLQAAALFPRKTTVHGEKRRADPVFEVQKRDREGDALEAQSSPRSFSRDRAALSASATPAVGQKGLLSAESRAGASPQRSRSSERRKSACASLDSPAWIPATSADWFAGAENLPASVPFAPWVRPTLESDAREASGDAGTRRLLAPPGGASSFWTQGEVRGGGRLGSREEAESSVWRFSGGQTGGGRAAIAQESEATSASFSPKVLTTSLFLRSRAALGLSAPRSGAAAEASSKSVERRAMDSSALSSSSFRTIKPPPVAPAAFVFSAIGVAEGMVSFAASRARQEYDKRLGSRMASSAFFGKGGEAGKNEAETEGRRGETAPGWPSFASRGSTEGCDEDGATRGDSDLPATAPGGTIRTGRAPAGPLAEAVRAMKPVVSSSAGDKERKHPGEGIPPAETDPVDAHLAAAPPARGQVRSEAQRSERGKEDALPREVGLQREGGREEGNTETRTKSEEQKREETAMSPEAVLTAEPHVLSSLADSSGVGLSIVPFLLFWPQTVGAGSSFRPPSDSTHQPPGCLHAQALVSLAPASGWDLPLLLFCSFLVQAGRDTGEEDTGEQRLKRHATRPVCGEQTEETEHDEKYVQLSHPGASLASFQAFLQALLQTDVEAAFLVAALLSLVSRCPRSFPSGVSFSGDGDASSTSARPRVPKARDGRERGLQPANSRPGVASAFPQCALLLLHSFLAAAGDAAAERRGDKPRGAPSSPSPFSLLSSRASSASAWKQHAAFCPPSRVWSGAPCAARADVATEVLLQLLLRWEALFFASCPAGRSPADPDSPLNSPLGPRARERRAETRLVSVSPVSLVHSLFLVRDFLHASSVVLLLLGLLPEARKEETGRGPRSQRPPLADSSLRIGDSPTEETLILGDSLDAAFLSSLAGDPAFRRHVLLRVTQAFPEKIDSVTALLPAANSLQSALGDLDTWPWEARDAPPFSLLSLCAGDRRSETDPQRQGREQRMPSDTRPKEERTPETEARAAGAAWARSEQAGAQRDGGHLVERGGGAGELPVSREAARSCEEPLATFARSRLLSSSSPIPAFASSPIPGFASSSMPASASPFGSSPNDFEPSTRLSLQTASCEHVPAAAVALPSCFAGREAEALETQRKRMHPSAESKCGGQSRWGSERESLEAFRMRLETFEGLFLSPLQPLSTFVAELHTQMPLIFFLPAEKPCRGRRGKADRQVEEEGEEDEVGGVWETGRWIVRLLRIFTKAMVCCRCSQKGTATGSLGKEVKTLLDVGGDGRGTGEEGEDEPRVSDEGEERRASQLGAQLQAAGVFAVQEERSTPSASAACRASPSGALQGVLEKTLFLRSLFSCAARAAGCSPQTFLSAVLFEDWRRPVRRREGEEKKEEKGEGEETGDSEGEREDNGRAGVALGRATSLREAGRRRENQVATIVSETGLGCAQVDDALSVLFSLLPLVDITSLFLPRSWTEQKDWREKDPEEERGDGRRREASEEGEEEKGQDPFLQAVLEALGQSPAAWPKRRPPAGEAESVALLVFLQQGPPLLSRRAPASFVVEALFLRYLERQAEAGGFSSLVSLSAGGTGRQEDDNGEEAFGRLKEGGRAMTELQPAHADAALDTEDFVSLLLPFLPLSRWESTVRQLSVRLGLCSRETQTRPGTGWRSFARQAALLHIVQHMRQSLERCLKAGKGPGEERRKRFAGDQKVDRDGETQETQLVLRNTERPLHLLQQLRFQEAWLLLATAWDLAFAQSSPFCLSSCLLPSLSPSESPCLALHTHHPSPSSSSPFSLCSLFSSPSGILTQDSFASACVNVLLYCEESKFPGFASSFWFALASCPSSLFSEHDLKRGSAARAAKGQEKATIQQLAATGLGNLRTRAANLLAGLSVSAEGVEDIGGERQTPAASVRARETACEADSEAGSAVGAFVVAGLLPWLQNLHARLCGASSAGSGDEERDAETVPQKRGVSDTATVLFAHTGHHFQLLLQRLGEVPGSAALKNSLLAAVADAVGSWILALCKERESGSPAVSAPLASRLGWRQNDAQTLLFCLVLCDSLLQHSHRVSPPRGSPSARASSLSAARFTSPFSRLEAILLWLTAQCIGALVSDPQEEEMLGAASRGGEMQCESARVLSSPSPSSRFSVSALSALLAEHERQRLRGSPAAVGDSFPRGRDTCAESEENKDKELDASEEGSSGFAFCQAFIHALPSSSQRALQSDVTGQENAGETRGSSSGRDARGDALGRPSLPGGRLLKLRSLRDRLDRLCGVVLLAAESEQIGDRFSAEGSLLWVPPAAAVAEGDGETEETDEQGRREKRDGKEEEERSSEQPGAPASPRTCGALWRSLLASAETEEEALLIALFAPVWRRKGAGHDSNLLSSVSWFESSPALRLLSHSADRTRALSFASPAEGGRPQEAAQRALAWLRDKTQKRAREASSAWGRPPPRLTTLLEKGHALLLTTLSALSDDPFAPTSPASVVVATLSNRAWVDVLETGAPEAEAARRQNLQTALPGLVISGDCGRKESIDGRRAIRGGIRRPPVDSWEAQDFLQDEVEQSLMSSQPRASFPGVLLPESFKSWPAERARVAAAVCAWYREVACEAGESEAEDAESGEAEEQDRDEREEYLLAVLAHVLQWLTLLRPHLLSRLLRKACGAASRGVGCIQRETCEALRAGEAPGIEAAQQAVETSEEEEEARWRVSALRNAVDEHRLSVAAPPCSRSGALVRRPWSRPGQDGEAESEGAAGERLTPSLWELEREQGERLAAHVRVSWLL